MGKGASRYRPDIDGLRALAIIPVVAFHAGLPGFSGGFVGVDVFFVISGFLITGLLLREQEQDGRIALLDFYARRVRRLLPALSLVILATLAAGFVWLPPSGDQQRLAGSVVAASTFVSNIYFWRQQGGYFGPQADVQPLLHTWTLAVEEQFYLVWPLGMMLIALVARRLHWPLRRTLAVVLVLGIVVSLGLYRALSQFAAGSAFYLTPSRAWELGLGALLALAPAALPQAPRSSPAVLAALGVAAILTAVIALPGQSLPVLVSTLGALAVLAAGLLAPDNALSRVLGAAPLRLIGKVSYSWYLWHWPLLAVVRLQTLGARDLPRDLGLAALALLLAVLTYVFVEQPIRQRRLAPFKTVRGSIAAGVGLMALCIAAAAALALAAHQASGPGTLARAAIEARDKNFGALQRCHHVVEARFQVPPIEACSLGAPHAGASVVLLGDSLAQQLIPPLDVSGHHLGVTIIARTASGCRPFRQALEARPDDCVRYNRTIAGELDAMKRDHGLKGVVVGSIWDQLTDKDVLALRSFVADLHRHGLRVILVAQPPNGPRLAPDCLGVRGVHGCALTRAEVETARRAQMQVLGEIARDVSGVEVLDPVDAFCGPALCPSVIDGVVAYRDRGHISRAGSLRLTQMLEGKLAWATAAGP